MNRKIDHIVYCVSDLDKAIDNLKNLLGIRPVIGGSHLTKGTKNALLNLGNKCYLEILAIDSNNVDFEGQRWMGIDLIDGPKITRWSLKSENLKKDSEILGQISKELGKIDGGSRMTADGRLLSWQMILPTSSPEIELLPFMTDWSQSSAHPTDTLEQGCSLQHIELYHPNPTELQSTLSNLDVDLKIEKAKDIRISIDVISPKGIKKIG